MKEWGRYGIKVEFSGRIKDGNSRLVVEEDKVQRTRKECFENLYNMNT